MKAVELLAASTALASRKGNSDKRLVETRRAFADAPELQASTIAVFCAGSLGRSECTERSDLDLFVVAGTKVPGRLDEVKILARLIALNEDCKFPPFSQAMRYLRIYEFENLVQHTGKPIDDSENSFTTRMLMVLESKYLTNESEYRRVLNAIVRNYFRDNKGKSDFRPLFLINDLLRYWRTLCLNYEECRADSNKPWRKKNINLKFARMTTVFATVLLLMVERPTNLDQFIPFIDQTPLQRLAHALDKLDDNSLTSRFEQFLSCYDAFLQLKEVEKPEELLRTPGEKEKIRAAANYVSEFLYSALMHEKNNDLKRYLVL